MQFPFSSHTMVKDIVNELPKSSDLFKKHRIDFCCGGNIPLSQAAAEIGIDVERLLTELKEVLEKSQPSDTHLEVWTNSDSLKIIDHIIDHYHNPLREEFLMLSPYVTKVSRVHGDNHPELLKVYDLFHQFRRELLEHMEKEETIVFPLIKKLAENTVENREEAIGLITELEKEHDIAGSILKELRSITSDYALPLDACGTYRLVYNRLEMMEEQTFMHVHLENNILFPRYIQ
jgi:regulator of cell morphogenesis and NO signaling